MKKLILVLFTFCNLTAQTKQTLNDVFENALISDTVNNIERDNPIRIIDIDKEKNKIKTNYSNLNNLLVKATNNQQWFITQSEEGSTLVEIKDVDVNTGWITLGETLTGYFNMDDGETLEFFNPFINYEIINNKPLFDTYPRYINDDYINYIQSGGIIKTNRNNYKLLTSVVFGAHKKRAIYSATSKDLENWTFHKEKILDTEQIPFAKKEGNVFSSGNPLKLEKNKFLVLLGVEQPNGNYTSAYMIIDHQLKIIQQPQEIKISNWFGMTQNSFPLSIIKHKSTYRILLHRRSKNSLENKVHEITTKNLFRTLNNGDKIITSTSIQNAKKEKGYLRGKADDASYLIFNSELYIILGSEQKPSEYLTSLNREYGLLKLENNIWKHDIRSPLIINPMNIYQKYPEYEWASDHLGGFISPIFKDKYLYLFLTFGTDNPDYLISGIKVKIKD